MIQKDFYKNYQELPSSLGMQEFHRESYIYTPKTEIIDTLINVETGEETVIHQGSNLIVKGFGIGVALWLSSQYTDGGPESGILWMAFGEGEGVDWDSLTTGERQAKSVFSLEMLYGEIFRLAPTDIVFLDEDDLEVSIMTNKIAVRVLVGSSFSGSLREFGLFVGNTATSTPDSGILINHKSHSRIDFNLDSAIEQILSREIRITT